MNDPETVSDAGDAAAEIALASYLHATEPLSVASKLRHLIKAELRQLIEAGETNAGYLRLRADELGLTTGAEMIEITQDYEFDEDCGIGGPISSFWATGHGHDPERFIRAVIDHTIEEHGSVPRIDPDDVPVEMWQRVIDRCDGVEYSRYTAKLDHDAEPITVLDLERPARGGTKCGVNGCGKPWSSGRGAIVRIEANNDDPTVTNPHMTVRMWFCREHGRRFPEPSYRVCMVPVGATIMLPPSESDASEQEDATL